MCVSTIPLAGCPTWQCMGARTLPGGPAPCATAARAAPPHLRRVGDHEVDVQECSGVLAQALHNGRPQREVGHKVAVLRQGFGRGQRTSGTGGASVSTPPTDNRPLCSVGAGRCWPLAAGDV